MIIRGKRNKDNKLYTKLRFLWKNMYERCYNENHPRFKNYGGAGVYMSEDWKTLNGFIDSVDLVEGWDLLEYLEGNLVLDKDSKVSGNMVYSVDTCKFISLEENNKIKPNQQKKTIGVNKFGEVYEFSNQSEFARTHNLRQSTISDCLSGRVKKHKGWKFYYPCESGNL